MELERINSIKIGGRLKVIKYNGKNSRRYLKLDRIYFIRKVDRDKSGNPHSIFLRDIGKRFGLDNFEIIFNKYDWINS